MGYIQIRDNSKVIIYECRVFIILTTGEAEICNKFLMLDIEALIQFGPTTKLVSLTQSKNVWSLALLTLCKLHFDLRGRYEIANSHGPSSQPTACRSPSRNLSAIFGRKKS